MASRSWLLRRDSRSSSIAVRLTVTFSARLAFPYTTVLLSSNLQRDRARLRVQLLSHQAWLIALMTETLQGFKAELFKALAHPARIRILELLRDGERSVTELQHALGTEGSTASQQLAILRMKSLVDTRKSGNNIFYSLRDPQVNALLAVARQMFDARLVQLQAMSAEEPTSRQPARAGNRRRRLIRTSPPSA